MTQTLRSLSRDPALLISASLTLAVCIAANTTLFSVANSILVRPLPYPDADRIDWISEISGPAQQDIGTAPDYYRLRDGNRVFEAVAPPIPSRPFGLAPIGPNNLTPPVSRHRSFG